MHRARYLIVVITAACGGSSLGNPDAKPADAAADAPADAQVFTGMAAIPLASADGTYYTAQVTIGSQKFAMVVDTGSSTAAVAGSSCSGCGVTPLYTPGSSATDTHTPATAQYGSGSWMGEIFKDRLGLGNGTPAATVALASITSQMTFFDNNQNSFQGLLGLGGDGLLTTGTTSYLDQVVATGMTDVESFQMCDGAGGTMWLGGFDPNAAAQNVQYTGMNGQLPYYAVQMSNLQLGTTSLGFTPSVAIVDTGTTLFYTSQAVANAVVTKANTATTAFTGQFQSEGGIYCATAKSGVTASQIDAALPPLTFTFPASGGSTFTVSAPATRSYLLDMGGGMWCIGIASNPGLPSGVMLMGDVGLRGLLTVFDRANHRIGFAPEKGCAAAPAAQAWKTPQPLRERGHIPAL
jgi:hypothetical protein